ncbi:MAG TPA: MFS transporter [Xanthomonadales bacterium]|nr:MFS transporter [Xanthomonadales bacterium]
MLASVRPYLQREPLAALCLGLSSGFPYAMIGATLTTRLAQDGIDKRTITAFSLAFLMYNLKFLWAPLIDGVRLPLLHRLGQRVSWMLLCGVWVMAAVIWLGSLDPTSDLRWLVLAALMVGVAGASYDIVIDAYRIETLRPEQLGVGSGMSQYGWRIGSVSAGSLALLVASHSGWSLAYLLCALLALPAMLTALVLGEPARHIALATGRGLGQVVDAVVRPLAEFLLRRGAPLVLLFVLLHKIGDTLANLTLRLLLNDLGFSNEEIATWDVGIGFIAYLVGIFLGGMVYTALGLKRSVLLALVLMAVSNLSFAWLAAVGQSNALLAFTVAFENVASGIGGVVVVAYLSALCNLAYTATQFALLSAAASVVGRLLSGTTAGGLIEALGYVPFYLLTTLVAVPGILLYVLMMRTGLIDRSLGSAGRVGTG